MATAAEITQELMEEIGKMSPDVETSLLRAVEDVTVDLLSQNEGRFEGLRRRQEITIDSTKSQYRLNSDCNAVKSPCIRKNSSGTIVGEIDIITDDDYNYRVMEGTTRYPANTFARTEYLENGSDGPGFYLVFSDELTDAGTLEVPYYRYAKETDTGLIRNTSIVKAGVRGRRPAYWPAVHYAEMGAYLRMRSGFKESPGKKKTKARVLLSKKKRQFNRRQDRIARGL